MSTLALLREEPSRRALHAITHQIGYGTLARAGTKAVVRSRLNRAELPRQFFLSLWDTLGQREAIVDGDQRVTFAQFKDRVLRLANGLHQLGLREGDACAELLYNCSHWFELNLACALTGMAMPMLNWHLRPSELVECIQRANAKVLVVDANFADMVAGVRDQIPSVQRILLTGADRREGFDSFEELIRRSAPALPPGHFAMSSKPYSGGTTGTPKYINLNQDVMFGESDTARRGVSREQVTRLTLMQASAFDWYGLGECHDPVSGNARSLIPGPLYHAGVQIGVLPFFFGGTVVPMRKFTAEGFLKAIQDERINWTFVAPTMLERVVGLPDEVKNKYNLSSMRTIICAAAPCPPKVKQEINALFRRQGAKDDVFHEYYAASETGLVTILAPEDYQAKPKRYDSVGKVRGCEVGIWDADKQAWCPVGKEGKVIMRTPTVYGLEYAGVDEAAMRKNFLEIGGQLWYDDGLIGYLDEDGFLYLTSRVKEMIISGGVNLFPNEIEHAIKLHPKVADVAVVRAPDKDLGEVPAAVIQLKEGEHADAAEILAHCKDTGLYGFKLPKIIDFVDQLPRNLAGKLPKKDLEARYWEGVAKHG